MLLRVKIAFLFISFQLREHSKTGLGHKLTVSDTSFAPCKGIQDGLGFWIPCCGFRIPGTGFRIPAQWIPDSKKSWIPFFYRF